MTSTQPSKKTMVMMMAKEQRRSIGRLTSSPSPDHPKRWLMLANQMVNST